MMRKKNHLHQIKEHTMESLSQEHLLPQVETALLEVLTTQANALARPTGFVQRQGKLSGADFVRLLVLGFLHDPQASLEALAQFGADLDIDISAQGLDQRFSVQAATFLSALFEVALTQVVLADPVAMPLLRRFGAVVLEDSTSIRLPDELAGLFQGCGGHHAGAGTMAACKLHLRLEMLRGQLSGSSLLDGRQPDSRTPLAEVPLAARTLTVRDRGYLDTDRWMREAQQEVWALTYYKAGIKLFDRQGQPLDLLLELTRIEQQGEREVLVGAEQRFPMRLLMTRVPQEVAEQRREYLRREALTHGRGSSHESELLAGWTLVLTSVPASLLSLEEAIVLLRLRWQIELLFKLWKQYGRIDEWRSRNPWRILCELYAKLIAMLLQHWLLVVGCWQDPHRSLSKAAKAVRSHANMLAAALVGDLPLPRVLRRIQRAMGRGARLNSRRDAPNASQLVLDGLKWSQKPLKRKKHR
jgi:Transposase DDE domain